ncbi:MAG TPA: emp24/gp25L/p24 family protein [Pyrinomonadaceae bacterium]
MQSANPILGAQTRRETENSKHGLSAPETSSAAPATPRQNSNSAARILLLLIVLGLVGFGAFQVVSHQAQTNYNYPSYSSGGSNSSLSASYSPTRAGDSSKSAAEPQSHRIVNEAFTLKAGEFASYKFTIPKSSSGGTVTGNFTASGGSNDIFVVITNQAGVTNIKNGNSYKAYYDSGKVTTDDINLNLAPGTYYIVFSNIHSLMTPKAVNADVSVEF